MPYIYEGHMGGLYTTDEPLAYEEEYCEQCGDSDQLLGYAKDKKDAWKLLKPLTSINNSGGWNYDYVQKFISENFDE